jgi:hypothetical protein
MKRAVDNNMFLVTHIHLDDGLQKGTWRNAMIFNPNQKYGAMTFWEAVGKPTALAIKDANYKKRDVYYAMQVGGKACRTPDCKKTQHAAKCSTQMSRWGPLVCAARLTSKGSRC